MPLGRVFGFGALLVLASLLAWFAPGHDRRDARTCVIMLVVGWFLYVTSWAAMAPVHVLNLATGVRLTAQEMWAVIDVLTAVSVLAMYQRSPSVWRLALACSLLAQLALHSLNVRVPETSFTVYTRMLDGLWLVQLLCLVSAGRGGYDSDWLFHSSVSSTLDHSGSGGAIRSGAQE